MNISNIRLGFATNSSSTHSIIILPGQVDDMVWEGEFGWQNFTLASSGAKMLYLAVCIDEHLSSRIGVELSRLVVRQLLGVILTGEESIDHQSIWALPVDKESMHGLNIEFINDLRDYLRKDDLVILGGNDNEYDHPLGPGYILPFNVDDINELYEDKLLARKDMNYWTLFNTTNGAKIRFSFGDLGSTPEYSTYPELVDMKITDRCFESCKWCYADSTPTGEHATRDNTYRMLFILMSMGIFEVALGGGNVMDHPQILDIVSSTRRRNIIPNITCRNPEWMMSPRYGELINSVGRIGVTAYTVDDIPRLADICTTMNIPLRKVSPQVVVGIPDEYTFGDILRSAHELHLPVTLLGYKHCGRGSNYVPNEYNLIDIIMNMNNRDELPTISIDTALALQYNTELAAMGIPRIMYTTDEGRFSMYIDAVNMVCGPSSYHPLSTMVPIPDGCTTEELAAIYSTFRGSNN